MGIIISSGHGLAWLLQCIIVVNIIVVQKILYVDQANSCDHSACSNSASVDHVMIIQIMSG